MQNIRNILISLVLILFLLGPTCIFATEQLHLNLPTWLTAKDAQYLEGSQKTADLKSNLTLKGLETKTLQSAVETEISDRIPFKADVILTNAALQKAAISTSNSIWNWECYPTYFGSNYIYIVSADAISIKPSKAESFDASSLHRFTQGLSEIAEQYPDKEFIVFIPASEQIPACSPAYELMSNPLTAEYAINLFLADNNNNLRNLSLVSDIACFSSIDEYYCYRFRTDSHWNELGAIQAFNIILETIGLEPNVASYSESLITEKVSGSWARASRNLVTEPFYGLDIDYSEVTFYELEDSKQVNGNNHDYYASKENQRFFDFHGSYYTQSKLFNGPGQGTALLLMDSYGQAIARPLASRFEKMYCEMLFYYKNTEGSIPQLIETNNPDTIIIVATLGNVCAAPSRIHDLFEIE